MVMSPDSNILIAYCSIPCNEAAFYAHKFMYDPLKDIFISTLSQDARPCVHNHNRKDKVHSLNPKNLTINQKGEIIEIKVTLF